MTTSFQWSNAELGRVYSAAYQGRVIRACLATNTGSLTINSTTAQWDAAEITAQAADGYERVIWTLPAGSYDDGAGQFLSPNNLTTFQADADGLGLTFDTVYLVGGTVSNNVTTWDTHVSGVYTESPSIALSPGEPRSYDLFLLVDDVTTIA